MEESTYNEHGDDFLDGICPPDLPEYLKSFSGTGISDARLKQFNWLHPRNYSGQGSLSEADTLSPYGTSVSSPRGDEWELVDHGPRKSIDELWDEAFEYRQRIKALEQQQMAAEAAELLESILMTSEYGANMSQTRTWLVQTSKTFKKWKEIKKRQSPCVAAEMGACVRYRKRAKQQQQQQQPRMSTWLFPVLRNRNIINKAAGVHIVAES
ncbi:hypothetical protein BG004_004564 [Podila humilis]|nr:hypothetical protein BG004_004564 [Podila humilis]